MKGIVLKILSVEDAFLKHVHYVGHFRYPIGFAENF